MNATIELSEQEIKEAITEYLSNRGIVASGITISSDVGDYNSPDQRDHVTSYVARVTMRAETGAGRIVVSVGGNMTNARIQQGNR